MPKYHFLNITPLIPNHDLLKLNPVPKSYERLFKFSRLMCSMDFDYVMEGLQYESELKHKVIKMQVSA